jgi:adenine phosphoribosyltransferase
MEKRRIASMDLKKYISEVQDFPIPGVSFKDVTPLLNDGEAFSYAIQELVKIIQQLKPDVIISPEARGFIFGAAVAAQTKIPFVPVRKEGKLPRKAISVPVILEYGQTNLFMHEDAIRVNQRVVIIDDVLATGGTSLAIAQLVEKLQGKVISFTFLINLTYLPGAKRISDAQYPLHFVINY